MSLSYSGHHNFMAMHCNGDIMRIVKMVASIRTPTHQYLLLCDTVSDFIISNDNYDNDLNALGAKLEIFMIIARRFKNLCCRFLWLDISHFWQFSHTSLLFLQQTIAIVSAPSAKPSLWGFYPSFKSSSFLITLVMLCLFSNHSLVLTKFTDM